ncbi:MAG: zinc ribbon domain-containing protein [Comamonadaceae bacterium]|nr:MAG: zinc ribbon domain-containing protein [Comamonadaceae bacterium]
MNATRTDIPGQPSRITFMSAAASLIEATNAFRNVRAIILLGLTFVCAALVVALFGALGAAIGSVAIASLGGLLGFVVAFYGANAVGILLMREAQGEASPNILDAVTTALFSSHRVIGVVLLQLLIVLAAVIIVSIVLFICKVPLLGPLLLTVVFPVSALLLGVLVFALFYVMLPLAGPAVWSGSTAFQTIARLNAIARRKLIPVILLEVALFIITMFTAMLIFTVVFIGLSMAGGMSAAIIGMGSTSFGGMMNGMNFGGTGHMVAASIGGGILLAIAAVVPGLIFTKGMCIIYLDVTRDIDFDQSETSLSEGLAAVRKKAGEARDKAKEMAEQAKTAASSAASSPAPAPAPAPAAQDYQAPAVEPVPRPALRSLCPNCNSPVASDDAFCGNCGFKLR